MWAKLLKCSTCSSTLSDIISAFHCRAMWTGKKLLIPVINAMRYFCALHIKSVCRAASSFLIVKEKNWTIYTRHWSAWHEFHGIFEGIYHVHLREWKKAQLKWKLDAAGIQLQKRWNWSWKNDICTWVWGREWMRLNARARRGSNIKFRNYEWGKINFSVINLHCSALKFHSLISSKN